MTSLLTNHFKILHRSFKINTTRKSVYPAPELLTTAANKPDQDPPEEISNINETLVEGRKVPLITKITLR